MHFTLDGKGVSVYTLRPKDKRLVCLRHSLDHFRADRAYHFAVYHTGEIRGKDILETVFLIPHATDDVLIQNIGHKIRLQPARIDDFFIVALRFLRLPLTFSKRSSNCCNSSLFSGFFRRLLCLYGRSVCGIAIQWLPSL